MADIDNWQGAVMASMVAAELLNAYPLAELVRAGERAESIGPLADPTLWREKHQALSQNLVVLKAASDNRGCDRRRAEGGRVMDKDDDDHVPPRQETAVLTEVTQGTLCAPNEPWPDPPPYPHVAISRDGKFLRYERATYRNGTLIWPALSDDEGGAS